MVRTAKMAASMAVAPGVAVTVSVSIHYPEIVLKAPAAVTAAPAATGLLRCLGAINSA